VDDYSAEEETAAQLTDVADSNEDRNGSGETHSLGTEDPVAEGPESPVQELLQQPEETSFNTQSQGDTVIEPEADHHSTNEDAVEQHTGGNSVAGDAYGDELLDDTVLSRSKDAVAVSVEEELLEYEDGHDDPQTTQHDTAAQPQKNEKPNEEDADGELLGAEEGILSPFY
jgi:hypothetical protein